MFQFPGFQSRLHLDFETYSKENISKAGAHKYAKHPSTEVLMLAWAQDDGPVWQWLPHKEAMPQVLKDDLCNPNVAKVAFNAAFERLIFEHVLGLPVPEREWRCTMVAAYYLGFSGGLDSVLSQTPLDIQKDPRGGQLINRFSKPAPKNHHADRYTWENKPEEWREFCEYNIQDVVVERELLEYLSKFPMMQDWDWERYAIDQRINDRGIYIDVAMAEGALAMWDKERANLTEQLRQVTGLEKVTREPFMQWLDGHGHRPSAMRQEILVPMVDEAPPTVSRALSLWLQKEKKAVTKYSSAIKGADSDWRARGMFAFKGASRTDRTSGRRIQLQNLKRPIAKTDAEAGNLRNAIVSENPGLLKMVSGEAPAEAMGASIRHCIQASPGHKLAVADLNSIESVVLGWLTYCSGINHIFKSGKDTYKPFASRHFGIPYEEVTKEQRTFAKPAVLGAGYMLGGKGMHKYAESMGVEMTEDEASQLVTTFREMYSEVPVFWSWIDQAVKYTVITGKPCSGYRLSLERDNEFLRIWLPSGRALSYHLPEVRKRVAPWSSVETKKDYGNRDPLFSVRAEHPNMSDLELAHAGLLSADEWRDNVSYMGTNLATYKWERIYVHAGSFTENIVQSIAYDILFEGIMRAEGVGLPVVLQVHDEIGVEVPEEHAKESASHLAYCMGIKPEWAPDMELGAEAYEARYYTKD